MNKGAKTMKKLIILIILIVILPVSSYGRFYGGNRLVKYAREYDKHIAGVSYDVFKCGSYMGAVMAVYDATNWKYNKLDDNTTSGQLFAIVSKYLKAHPKEWTYQAYFLIELAFFEAFGMNEKNKSVLMKVVEIRINQ